MNEDQRQKIIAFFNEVKEISVIKSYGKAIKQYTYKENSWTYDFYTVNNILKKVEASNHREIIEVYIK